MIEKREYEYKIEICQGNRQDEIQGKQNSKSSGCSPGFLGEREKGGGVIEKKPVEWLTHSLARSKGGWSEKARTNVRLVCHGVRLMLAAPTSRVCPATTHRAKSSLPTRPTLGLQSHPTSQANNLSRNFAIQPEHFGISRTSHLERLLDL